MTIMTNKSSDINQAAKIKAERQKLRKYLRKGDMVAVARVVGVTGGAVQRWFLGLTIDSPIIEEHVTKLVVQRKLEIQERSKDLYKI